MKGRPETVIMIMHDDGKGTSTTYTWRKYVTWRGNQNILGMLCELFGPPDDEQVGRTRYDGRGTATMQVMVDLEDDR